MVIPSGLRPPTGILKGAAIRNWLRTGGQGIFVAFKTGREALSYIRQHVGAIRDSDFYGIRREKLSISADALRLRDYPGNQLVPLAWHNKTHNLMLSSEFQYRIELLGFDAETGEMRSQWMTVASDRQLSLDEIQDVARNYIGEGGESGEIVLSAFGTVEPLERMRS